MSSPWDTMKCPYGVTPGQVTDESDPHRKCVDQNGKPCPNNKTSYCLHFWRTPVGATGRNIYGVKA